ncbi:MAG: hypothetical protein NTV34_13745, partial [Proteobacteria bacterium]|nr:hypothetical protein [Pseudomonadota bacterium]
AWIRKSAERRKVALLAESNTAGNRAGVVVAQIGDLMPTLAAQALSAVAAYIDSQLPLEESLPAAMRLLEQHHPGRAILFMADQPLNHGCVYPEVLPVDIVRVHEAISLYFNLRSTLTMHLYHASWLHETPNASGLSLSMTGSPLLSDEPGTPASFQNSRFDPGATAAIDQNNGASAADATRVQSMAGSHRRSNHAGREVSGMFAIVPVRVGGDTAGVILIEELSAAHAVDLNATRRELDLFGIHVGSLMAAGAPKKLKSSGKERIDSLYKHVHGAYIMEPCPWLNFKFTGNMRTGREASWYLGLQWSQDQFVVVYCCLRGFAADRDQFSAEIFRQVLAVREFGRMSGRARFEMADLRSELGGLFTRTGLSSRMDEILFAFSIFDRSSPEVVSGHFGGARPVVVAAENIVEAFNQVPVQLRDGRDVRYWEVLAQLDDNGLYILSFDTSRLRTQVAETGLNRRSVAAKTEAPEIATNSRRYLEAAIARNELPRYYLAITRKSQVAESEGEIVLASPA